MLKMVKEVTEEIEIIIFKSRTWKKKRIWWFRGEIFFSLFFLIFIFTLFCFTILYWFCHTLLLFLKKKISEWFQQPTRHNWKNSDELEDLAGKPAQRPTKHKARNTGRKGVLEISANYYGKFLFNKLWVFFSQWKIYKQISGITPLFITTGLLSNITWNNKKRIYVQVAK